MSTVPHLFVRNAGQVRYKTLKQKLGIKYLIFDKDNTLTFHNQENLLPELKTEFFYELIENFYGNVFLLTNNYFTDITEPDFNDFRRMLGLPLFSREGKFCLVCMEFFFREISDYQ